jgi:hypothetical protein
MFYLTNCLFILLYVPFAYCLYLYPYYDLMVQVIFGRWCTCVLVNSLRMCLSRQTLMLGQQRMIFAMLLGTSLPPHPLHMSLEQLLATQNELMRVLTKNLV